MNDLITHAKLRLAHVVRQSQAGKAKGKPCLVLLHGVGANERSLEHLAAQVDPRFTVILVRSPFQLGPMQFGFFRVSFTSAGPQIDPAQAEQSRRLLAGFIEALPEVYGIDPKQVWIAGFSQGGILSASLGLTRPELVRGFAILSGRILPEIEPQIATSQQLAGLTAFVSHGVQDNKLTVEFARSARQLLTSRQVALTYTEYPASHELSPAMVRDFKLWLQQGLDQGSAGQ